MVSASILGFLYFIIFAAFCCVYIPVAQGMTSLYSDSVAVIELPEMPSTATLCPFYVVMYVNWCPHCQAFSPFYSSFALAIEDNPYGLYAGAIDCTRYSEECLSYNVTGYPVLWYYNGARDGKPSRVNMSSSGLNPMENRTHTPVADPVRSDSQLQKKCKEEKLKIHMASAKYRRLSGKGKVVQWFDRELSFHHSIQTEVLSSIKSSNANRADEKVKAYRDFIRLVYECFPSYRDQQLHQQHPGGIKGCGFTCGMWRLYHSLTVISPNSVEALLIIRNYIITFFSCQSCRKHFTEMSANVEQTVISRKDAILWLWRAHSKVSERVSHNKADRWPTVDLCPTCYVSSDEDVNENAVVEFLEQWYGAQSSSQRKSTPPPKSGSHQNIVVVAPIPTETNNNKGTELHHTSVTTMDALEAAPETWKPSHYKYILCIGIVSLLVVIFALKRELKALYRKGFRYQKWRGDSEKYV
eukprot:PhF_6_TR18947/c0_g1_i2/m.27775/K10758/QSOX; thiol oxidase